MSRRLNILEAVRSALQAWPALGQIPVTIGRVYPEAFARLPMINVVGGQDDRESDQPARSAEESRNFEVVVQVAVTAAPELLEETLELLCLEVERALALDDELGGRCEWFRWATSPAPTREELDAAVAMRELAYLARYTVQRADPI